MLTDNPNADTMIVKYKEVTRMADIRPMLTEVQKLRWRKRMSKSHIKYVKNTPGERKRLSNMAKLLWSTPEFRKNWHRSRPRKERLSQGNYWRFLKPNHPRADKKGYVYEHILIAENGIQRSLKKGEVVHHINGNGKDNSPSNLVVLSQREHIQHHNRKRQSWKKAVEALRKNHPFTKFSKPTARKIRRLYRTGNFSQVELAKQFGVCQMTISKLTRKVTLAYR